MKAPLNLHQKLTIVKRTLIPRLLSKFCHPDIGLTTLSDVDRSVRKHVKAALHLPTETTNAFIHAPVREGGLGIMSLRVAIPRIMVGWARGPVQRRGELTESAGIHRWVLDRLASLEHAILIVGQTNWSHKKVWSSRLDAS